MALVISRRWRESFRVGEAVITVLSLNGTKVRFSIDAPRDVTVARTEVDHREERSDVNADSRT